MELIKKVKLELTLFIVFSGLSVLYYQDTGEIKIIGILTFSVLLLSGVVRLCGKIIAKYTAELVNKNT
ncbi:MAG: hypothetical protein HWE26_22580 [Alteromonadaceae bacterium]|nr:hypothetical protein [Alteromonadaceae bacterium]